MRTDADAHASADAATHMRDQCNQMETALMAAYTDDAMCASMSATISQSISTSVRPTLEAVLTADCSVDTSGFDLFGEAAVSKGMRSWHTLSGVFNAPCMNLSLKTSQASDALWK